MSKSNKKILIATIYKPNKSDDKLFIDKLLNLLNDTSKKNYDEIISTSDFNFDLLKYEQNNIILNFINSLSSISLIPVITKPTRITDQTATLIDNIFISHPVNFNSGILISDISDHFPTFIHIKKFFCNSTDNTNVKIEYRLINDETISNFCTNISCYDFSNISELDDCSLAINQLTDIINHEYKLCCPLKSKIISYKNSIKPWISNEILSYIRKRHHYYILLRKKIISKKTYSNYRNFVTNKIRFAKKNFFIDKFQEIKGDIRQTWKIINNVLRPKTNKKVNLVNEIITNDVVYRDPNNICKLFNDFFVNIGRDLAESVENHDPDDHKFYLNNIDQQNSFFFHPILPSEIHSILNSLKNKSSDINTFSIKILKSIGNIISVPLANIINKSLSSGTFPDSLKIAQQHSFNSHLRKST